MDAPRHEDYGLVDIGEDDLYSHLLPHVVRGTDPGGILTYLRAMAENHNWFIQKLREMPRLQDPTKAAVFDPEALGESAAKWKELVALRAQRPTGGALAYLGQLERLLPKTLAAEEFERTVLALLAKTVGSRQYGQYQVATTRQLIRTAISRHHIKGTHASVYVLGRILGFVDLKVSELWSRFAIKDPGDPRAIKNYADFSQTPDQRPYWPVHLDYDGALTREYDRWDGDGASTYLDERFQSPAGDAGYDPNVLDDAGFTYSVTFDRVSDSLLSTYHYNLRVNGHNPFGAFSETVTTRLRPGIYTLSGGTGTSRASVGIPDTSGGGRYSFDAIAPGGWGNDVSLSLYTNRDGSQRVTLHGRQSKIKFKSSHFDLALTVDTVIYPTLYPQYTVVGNPGHSHLDLGFSPQVLAITAVSPSRYGTAWPEVTVDGDAPPANTLVGIADVGSIDGERAVFEVTGEGRFILYGGEPYTYDFDISNTPELTVGRLAGDYPVTANGSAVRVIADPADNWEMDMRTYGEVITSLRDMFETIQPATRTVRREGFGFLLRDQVPYAPVNVIPRVVLLSPGGSRYELFVDASGAAHWGAESDPPGDPATVVQRDPETGLLYRWAITDGGVFFPALVSAPPGGTVVQEHIVYVPTADSARFVGLDQGRLVTSMFSSEHLVDTIHTDGTDDESVIAEDYALHVESAPPEVAGFMSDDATSGDVPPDDFTFQTSPEDSLAPTRTHFDITQGHVGFGWNDEAGQNGFASMSEGGWLYDFSGNYIGADARLRHPGVGSGMIEPPPSGLEADPVHGNPSGLRYDYPVEFMNGHGLAAWRDRITNEPFASTYTYACAGDNPAVGATRHDTSLLSDDGPQETPTVAQTASPVAISPTGAGATPNDKIFTDDPGSGKYVIDALWQKYDDRSLTPVGGTYSEVVDSGGNAGIVLTGYSDIAAGAKVNLTSTEGSYGGKRTVVGFHEASPGRYILTVDTAFVASASGTLRQLTHEVMAWEDEDIRVVVEPLVASVEQVGVLHYRAVQYTSGYIGAALAIKASGAVTGVEGVDVTFAASRGDIIGVEVYGDTPVKVRIEHASAEAEIKSDDWGGHPMAYGGHRDSLDVALIEDGETWADIGAGGAGVSPYTELGGIPWWRGGSWG